MSRITRILREIKKLTRIADLLNIRVKLITAETTQNREIKKSTRISLTLKGSMIS